MEAEQLRQLAINAQINHWPPHLGVTTDAEKIEYLAQRLSEAADAETRADELSTENETLREERDDYERRSLHAENKLIRIQELAGRE